MTCSVCKNEMYLHNIRIRKHHHWRFQVFTKVGYAMVCGADPVHNVDLLLYDVWPI